jgi:hypothetical protein
MDRNTIPFNDDIACSYRLQDGVSNLEANRMKMTSFISVVLVALTLVLAFLNILCLKQQNEVRTTITTTTVTTTVTTTTTTTATTTITTTATSTGTLGFGVQVNWGDEIEHYVPDLWTLLKNIGVTRIRTGGVNRTLLDQAEANGVKVFMILGQAMSSEEVRTSCPWYSSKEAFKARIDRLNLAKYRNHEGLWGYDICLEPYYNDTLADILIYGLQYVRSIDPTHPVTVGLSNCASWVVDDQGLWIQKRKAWFEKFQPYVDVLDVHIFDYEINGKEYYRGIDYFKWYIATEIEQVIIPAAKGKPIQIGATGCPVGNPTPDGTYFTEEQQAEYFRILGEITKPRGIYIYIFKLLDTSINQNWFGLFEKTIVGGMNKPRLATEVVYSYLAI